MQKQILSNTSTRLKSG